MPTNLLTTEARRENAAALAAALGLALDTASEVLDVCVVVTSISADDGSNEFASQVAKLLERTLRQVSVDDVPEHVAAELVVGNAVGRTEAPKIYASITAERLIVGSRPVEAPSCSRVHGLLMVLSACYASAALLDRALGKTPFGVPDPLVFAFEALGIDLTDLSKPIDLGHAYLAGAGAIGNGLLWAARHLDLYGTLEVCDDDSVDSGNLNRQVWFEADDIGLKKVERLVLKAQPFFPNLTLKARDARLQELPERSAGAWLPRLIVAVDSRRARRQLQTEFPREVFDASTTDIREVVIHHNTQPSDAACMCCIYEPDREEVSREQHIAEHLGVSIESVRSERVSSADAVAIGQRFPALVDADLVGTAYDTLFKRLCGQGLLKTIAGRRVIAPFGFVSVLAGAMLAVEIVRRIGQGQSDRKFNYWRLSAWHAPLGRRRLLRPKQSGCSFCGSASLQRVNARLWPS